MTWLFIGVMLAVGFAEYRCAHYFTQKVFKLSENRAHLALGLFVLALASLPGHYILTAFFITCLFTPVIIWLGINFLRK